MACNDVQTPLVAVTEINDCALREITIDVLQSIPVEYHAFLMLYVARKNSELAAFRYNFKKICSGSH